MQQPNILFITTDQQRWDHVGLLGLPGIETPALDRIGREGVCLTRAYCPSPIYGDLHFADSQTKSERYADAAALPCAGIYSCVSPGNGFATSRGRSPAKRLPDVAPEGKQKTSGLES